ncbi:hypothetical protein GCM10012280_21440 [Wenjunlia tyrosinilytica]|uniref:Uncharacterized protein n=1 Tax=Wenjunlia tyrosinilytica TaxID=1544741 RepID=A0A917ZMH6_9ACTN|nr:hypothetical protein GCM10012280_21440 [Wenjunlia tyrosinilytica]
MQWFPEQPDPASVATHNALPARSIVTPFVRCSNPLLPVGMVEGARSSVPQARGNPPPGEREAPDAVGRRVYRGRPAAVPQPSRSCPGAVLGRRSGGARADSGGVGGVRAGPVRTVLRTR